MSTCIMIFENNVFLAAAFRKTRRKEAWQERGKGGRREGINWVQAD